MIQAHAQAIQASLVRFGPAIARAIILDLAGALPFSRLHMLRGVLESLLSFVGREAAGPWFLAALEPLAETVDPSKAELLEALGGFNPHQPQQTGQIMWNTACKWAEQCRIKDEPLE